MANWELELDDLKHYPHFDAEISLEEAKALISDPDRVSKNAFYPFIKYDKTWQPFRTVDPRPAKKSRFIRYAARKDAYILTHYRNILATAYEQKLKELGISDCPIAYRKILKTPTERSGKCNIDFAKDAFDAVEKMGDCCFIALDISKFFESLDHARLQMLWCSLLGTSVLPVDHQKVFNSVTKYAFVDRLELYRRLGFFGKKIENNKEIEGYLMTFKDIPKKLCSNEDFKEKIVGSSNSISSIIEVNSNPWGVPQGAPISDLLANLYLLDFDVFAKELADSRGGFYQRYSDDILFVLPISKDQALEIEAQVISKVVEYGDEIRIKSSKTSIVQFRKNGNALVLNHIKGDQGKNGAEYLGFRFDGKKVYLRDATLSGLYRKMASSSKAHCIRLKKRYPGKDRSFLEKKLLADNVVQSFGRVEDFDLNPEVENWTFWTYARRASQTFGLRGQPILKQLRNHKKFIVKKMLQALD